MMTKPYDYDDTDDDTDDDNDHKNDTYTAAGAAAGAAPGASVPCPVFWSSFRLPASGPASDFWLLASEESYCT